MADGKFSRNANGVRGRDALRSRGILGAQATDLYIKGSDRADPGDKMLQDSYREKSLDCLKRSLEKALISSTICKPIRILTRFVTIRDSRNCGSCEMTAGYGVRLLNMTHSQRSRPINVDRMTNTPGNALSPTGALEEFMIASNKTVG
jgi:hypothetical protein